MGKHNGSFGKQYGRVIGKDADERLGYVKKAEISKKEKVKEAKAKKGPKIEEEEERTIKEPLVPLGLQQSLLNVFRDAFPEVLATDTLQPLLQEVKAALYERDFNRAFGTEQYLEAYSIRWSPSRALCYASILSELHEELRENSPVGGVLDCKPPQIQASLATGSSPAPIGVVKVVCFGGGAAEVVAFGGFLRLLHEISSTVSSSTTNEDALENLSLAEKQTEIDVLLVDSAQWQGVISTLHKGLTSLPIMPKYSNAAARAANSALLTHGDMEATFQQEDILELSQAQLAKVVENRNLLTLLFT
jgi:25S rRNA (uracil2843-N3)-methyltransferase